MQQSVTRNQHDDGKEGAFKDAFDEFPFYDCADTFADDDVVSFVDLDCQLNASSPEMSSSPVTVLRHRRNLSHRNLEDPADLPSTSSPVSSYSYSQFKERKLRFSPKIMEDKEKSNNLDKLKLEASSTDRLNEEKMELSSFTNENENNEKSDDLVENISPMRDIEDTSSNILLSLAILVIKTIGFQINLLFYFITFPILSIYNLCMFVMDPFGVVRHWRNCVFRKLMSIWGFVCESVSQFVPEWLKEDSSVWKLGLRWCWGFLWSAYVCIVLLGLLLGAVIMGGLVIRGLVEEPIRIKEPLNFDYTEKSPVVYVPLLPCPRGDCGMEFTENVALMEASGGRVIPLNHKLKVTVALTLPESDYNRNLGIFQVRLDFLAADGRTLATSRRPTMLQFKSDTIRLLSTFLNVAPLIIGYASESQTLTLKFRSFTEGNTPTACLRVIIEQRAEFLPGAGIPEIYTGSLSLESELPLLKRILWCWKKTIFVWLSMTIFTVELIFILLCCKPLIIPRVKLGGTAAHGNAQPHNHLRT